VPDFSYNHRDDEEYGVDYGILMDIKNAHAEWLNAQNLFNNVSDPELVDYAIYNMEAAKKKYMYMLKQARMKGIEGINNLLYHYGE
jgi:hypothetical protein